MNLKSPSEDDYLGIYSIMFWTLTLIGCVKYACIALKADDQGEGGTFALYSLLCRHANISILSSKRDSISDHHSSPSPYRGTTKKSRLAILFEGSLVARRLLLFIAMLGMCMLIGDGILTPAISVLSAMDGLRAPFPSVTKTHVEALSAVILIVLFLVQKFGTSRVSFIFSPIMGTWTLTTPMVGIYSIVHYYPGILRLYHRTISCVSSTIMERMAGCYLEEPFSASQVLKHCLLILVISLGVQFKLHFCAQYILLWC